jgi:3-phenylpropionate/trans-cinnamate dioxygenase ferredoxin reductase subunit
MSRTVIVGASLAGLGAATKLREEGWDGELTVIGAEPQRPYDRPPLSKELLTGEMSPDDIALRVPEDLDVEWRLGCPATGLDVDARVVRTPDGDVQFDQLVIATGSTPRRLPGVEPDGGRIFELRAIEDALRLRAELQPGRRLVIVGAGFIGMEVASSARSLGVDVTLVSLDPPLALAGAVVSEAAAALLAAHDVKTLVPATIASLRTRDEVVEVALGDGHVLEADLVVVAIGARPQLDWLATSGLPVDGGLTCDAALRLEGTRGIVAAGDVARWPNPLFGGLSMRVEHWSNAIEQGAAAARTLLLGDDAPAFAGLPSFWSDHFGTRLQSIGLPALADRFDFEGDGRVGEPFTAAAVRDETVVGAVTYGQPRRLLAFRSRLQGGVALKPV